MTEDPTIEQIKARLVPWYCCGTVAATIGLLALSTVVVSTCSSYGKATYTPRWSPDDRYQVIEGSRSQWLDVYHAYWIADASERNSSGWHRICGWRDAPLAAEWKSPSLLIIRDPGQPRVQRYESQKWRDVEIRVYR